MVKPYYITTRLSASVLTLVCLVALILLNNVDATKDYFASQHHAALRNNREMGNKTADEIMASLVTLSMNQTVKFVADSEATKSANMVAESHDTTIKKVGAITGSDAVLTDSKTVSGQVFEIETTVTKSIVSSPICMQTRWY
jgi:hypothetical protein